MYAAKPVGVEHVVERVEERPQVGIDLGQYVAGEESEALAGLDGGAGQDDAPDLSLGEGRDGQRHREVGLARSGRPDAEGDRAATDRVDVVLLVDGLRGDLLAAMTPDDVLEDVADVGRLLERPEHRVDGARTDRVARFDELDELVEHGPRAFDVVLLAVERQPVASQHDRAAEAIAQRLEDAVVDRGQLGRDLVRNREDVLQPFQSRRRPLRDPSCARPRGHPLPPPAFERSRSRRSERAPIVANS